MNLRLAMVAAMAVILVSVREFALISGGAWLIIVIGAAAVIALAGTLTRLTSTLAGGSATLLAAVMAIPMLATPSLYWKVGGVAIVIACAASSRLRLLVPFATLTTYLAALLLYLNALFSGPQSLARVVPTAASLRHLLDLVSAGQATAGGAAPVLDTHGVQLLAAGGIGLAAVAVDFLAVRLHRPAIAGLPLLVVFMAPIVTAAKTGGIGGLFTFLLAAVGYLWLLSADGRERLRGWGRVVTVWHGTGEDEQLGGAEVGTLAATGRRIGFAAVCAAMLAPLLLPSLNMHRLFDSSDGGVHVQEVPLPNPVDQLHGLLIRPEIQRVLSYKTIPLTSPADFQPTAQYLQVYVLNYDNDSSSWQLVQPDHSTKVSPTALQPTPGLAPGTPTVLTRTKVTLGPVSGYAWPIFFLPVPYAPDLLQVPGSWREADDTLMIYSGRVGRNVAYTVTSQEADPTPAILEGSQQDLPASISAYQGFNSPVTNKLRAIAQQITRGTHNAYTRALALERWFLSGQFTYSLLSGVPNSPAGLLKFLTTSRHGYCQQFAFAFAVLARLVGIPSRIAIGYTAGQPGAHGTWQVTTADAHAWPELYFSGAGWIRFEPTPGGADGQGTAVQPSYVTAGSASTGPGSHTTKPGSHPSPAPSASTGLTHLPHVQVPPTGALPPSSSIAAGSGGASRMPLIIALLAILALAAAAPGTTRLVVRRRRWRAATGDAGLAQAAWLEICDDLEDFGLPCLASESPRTVARRVCSDTQIDAAAREAVGRIASTVEQAHYAPTPPAAGPIRMDVTIVRRALGRSSGFTARCQAGLLPASTLGPLRVAVRHGLGLLTGWMPTGRENSPA